MICSFVQNGICPVSKGLLQVNKNMGGTNKFFRHIQTHVEPQSDRIEQHTTLSLPYKNNIAKNAVPAVALDLRPLSFTENQDGMACLLRSVFEAGQSILLSACVDKESYIPSRTAIRGAMKEMASEVRYESKTKCLESGAVTTDGATLKVQNRNFYDFTINYFAFKKPQTFTDCPRFAINTSSIVLVEGP